MPDPIPRPTRFRFSVDLRGALIVERFISQIPCFKVSRFQSFKEKPSASEFYLETLQPCNFETLLLYNLH